MLQVMVVVLTGLMGRVVAARGVRTVREDVLNLDHGFGFIALTRLLYFAVVIEEKTRRPGTNRTHGVVDVDSHVVGVVGERQVTVRRSRG